MRAYRRRNWLAVTIVSSALFVVGTKADFEIAQVSPRVTDRALLLSGTLDLGLTAKVQEALSKGIPIEITIGVKLYRRRPILWDRRIQNWVLRRKISYHALSRQYLVVGHGSDPDAIESFTSMQAALVDMGSLNELRLPLESQLTGERAYYIRVRASLDIESLPAPLRPVAYTSLAWQLSSGWTEWNVQP
ncbi:MAG: DUF4390 domain-containing protein [Acidiferrobacterales bacterium]